MNDMRMLTKYSIFAHRGVWHSKAFQNTAEAMTAAKEMGVGVETDVRNFGNHIVLAHDPVENADHLDIEFLFNLNIRTAFNIKVDGLQTFFDVKKHEIEESNSFFFDGSLPEMVKYKNLGLPHALRLSEHEKELPWRPQYIWLDSFYSEWWIQERLIEKSEDLETEFIVVSPELHGRNPLHCWDYLRAVISQGNSNVSICTDRPFDFKVMIEN